MISPAQPLTAAHWLTAAERIESLWPGTKTWSKADELFETFRPYTDELVNRAISHLFTEGRQTAPSPSALMGVVRRIAGESGYSPSEGHPCSHSNLAHYTPSSHGTATWLEEAKGPGRLECAGCRTDFGACRCEVCRADLLYNPS